MLDGWWNMPDKLLGYSQVCFDFDIIVSSLHVDFSGGLTVLGFYIFSSEDIFEKQDGKIRKLISSVRNLDTDVPEEQIVIVNTNTAKVFDSKASAFKSIDMKMVGKPVEFVRVDTSVVLDIPIALTSDEKDLSKDVAPGVDKFADMLKHCIYVFDNQMLGDKHVVGKAVEVEKKKGKGKNKKEDAHDNSDLEDCSSQEVLNLELLFSGKIYAPSSSV